MDRLDDAYRRLEHGPGESRRAVAGEIAEMELMLGVGDLEISQDEPEGG